MEVIIPLKIKVKYLWWALLAGGLAVLAGIGALVRDLIRMHRWRVKHTPGPIA